jgi:hypothetical protein
MALSLAACGSSNTAPEPASSAPAEASASVDPGAESSTAAAQSAEGSAVEVVTGEPNIALEKAEDAVLGDDGTVLVNYEYQKAVVTLPDAAAQVAVQEDLDKELQIFLDSMNSSVADFAKDALSYSQEEADASASDAELFQFQPYYGQYTVTPSRVDDAVISLVIDSVSYAGGAHGSDVRYCLNYDAKTGERLTFDMLGSDFREKAEKLVLAKADKKKDLLDEGYASQIPFVVCDGTESVDEINRKVYPDLYEDVSMEPEEGTLDAEYYLNDKGVMFIAGEYVMKPYAGGIMEFGIPYKKFGDSFNETYLPASYKEEKEKKQKEKKDAKESAEKSTEPEAEASAEE